MLYTIISDDKLKFSNNPLVKEVLNVVKFKKAEFYLIHTFKRAVELFESTDYYSEKIEENIYWFEDSIEDFIIKHLGLFIENTKTLPLLSTEKIPEGLYCYTTDKLDTYYSETLSTFYMIDKTISGFFDISVQYNNSINYKNFFRLKLKHLGLVTEIFTLTSLEIYLKKIFKEDFWKYILVVWSLLYKKNDEFNADKKNDEFNADYEYKGRKHNAWDELFKVEDYLNNTRIYGVSTRSVDLNYNKDKNGKYYLQYEYSGAENTTGRIFTTKLNGYQALQNLPKDERKIIKAEKDCVLIEIDYKGFEFAILSSMLREEVTGDPHQNMIDNLFPKRTLDRQLGKDINYSVIYGKTLETIARELVEKFPEEEYSVIESKLKSQELFSKSGLFTGVLKKYNYKKTRMLLKNYFNRWIKVEKDWAVLNNFIQSTGVDFLCLKFNLVVEELLKYGEKNKILIQNHDSILLQLEDKVIDNTNLFETILSIMEEPFNDIKVQIEYKAGRNWGEMG